jgi:2-iminoacetate synthase
MNLPQLKPLSWEKERVKQSQIVKYMEHAKDFIDDALIVEQLHSNRNPDPRKVKDILDKALSIETLTPDETATLLNIEDNDLWQEIATVALEIKKKVYDNRIVTFAPLYLNNLCINNCLYCGFRKDNDAITRTILTQREIRREVEVLAGKIGHKRLIVVYGEHPQSDIEYMRQSIQTIYDVRATTKNGWGCIRRVNVNAPPLSIEELKILHKIGIGTYQVFQETYNHRQYALLHPPSTLKANYQWRLYSMHRALDAGIDDVGIGALFGLYDWKFEVMGLLYHARELEAKCGVGPHTVSFPRLEPAMNTAFTQRSPYQVSDQDFRKVIMVIRLAIPYTGMILTAREPCHIRRQMIPLGVTQTDASAKIGIGAYSQSYGEQVGTKQQFFLGDTRSLDEVVREFAQMGYITSFCTAGYRCGRTGKCIMQLLKSGQEGKFCKLNAILTFREWIDDFASFETKAAAEEILNKEIAAVKEVMPAQFARFKEFYERIKQGERDLYF